VPDSPHAHDHDHPHAHPHAHDHHIEAHRPHDEPVVLEIGGELGALIVYTDPSLLHQEIEISPTGEDERRSHKDVLERVVGGRSFYAAVFDRIPDGDYTLWHHGTPRLRGAKVAAGRIAELDWS
jgi:hypothetical protein